MPPIHYTKFSMSTLQIWVLKSGVLKEYIHSCGRLMGYHYTVVSRLVRKHIQTNTVKDLKTHVTSQREDRTIHRLVRWMPFATSPVLKRQWLPNKRMLARTTKNRLKSAGLKSRRAIKRPILSDRHQRLRLAWCLAHRDVNLRTWRRIHWSAESRFLLHVTDGRMRVYRQKYTTQEYPADCPLRWMLNSDMWCISHHCKLDLVTIRGNLTGDEYIRDV
jgi:hypothetical protein